MRLRSLKINSKNRLESETVLDRKLVSIVIPALNEEDGIRKTLLEIPRGELEKLGFDTQILVVDGNSDDDTQNVALKNGADVLIEPIKGYGRAYKTGFSYVKGDIVITLDADATYPASEIPDILRILERENVDFLTTNRFASMEDGAMSFVNWLGNKILSFVTRLLFSVHIKDSQSGMWVFKKEVLSMILPSSDGMEFSEEIKIRAYKNVRAMEIPICYRKREGYAKLRVLQDLSLIHI